MKKGNQKGVILYATLLMLLGLGALGMGQLFNTHLNANIAKNFKKRIQSFYAADGMVTLLSQEVLDHRDSLYVTVQKSDNAISLEIWSGISGRDVADLENDPRYPKYPTRKRLQSAFELRDITTNYGSRMHGWIYPPIAGFYTFHIASDANSELWLSGDDNPGSASVIAGVTKPTDYYAYFDRPEQTSKPIYLEADKRYYIRSLHKENSDRDHVSIAWNYDEEGDSLGGPPALVGGKYLSSDQAFLGSGHNSANVGGLNVQYSIHELSPGAFSISTRATEDTGAGHGNAVTLHQSITQPRAGGYAGTGDTVAVPVTFYDHIAYPGDRWKRGFTFPKKHADFECFGKNSTLNNICRALGLEPGVNLNDIHWDFNIDTVKLSLGMVEDSLGLNGLPVFKHYDKNVGCAGCRFHNLYLDKWFTDNPFGAMAYNMVIQDTLVFLRDPNDPRTYYFNDQHFFPLDNRGLVASNREFALRNKKGKYNNYGFTMHLQRTFTYDAEGAEKRFFKFTGDDDVWAFIDGRLVIDLGGTHEAKTDIFNLKEEADRLGLMDGQNYNFDFFYAERMQVKSTIYISSNMKIFVPELPDVRQWRRDYGNFE